MWVVRRPPDRKVADMGGADLVVIVGFGVVAGGVAGGIALAARSLTARTGRRGTRRTKRPGKRWEPGPSREDRGPTIRKWAD